MPFTLNDTRIKITDGFNKDMGIEEFSNLKDGRRIRKIRIGHYKIKDEKPFLKKNTILKAFSIYCKKDEICATGILNEKEEFIIENYYRGNAIYCIEIEFPNEKGKLIFQEAYKIFDLIGAMPYQSDYLTLTGIGYEEKIIEKVIEFLMISKCVNQYVKNCQYGKLALFVYYVIRTICYDKMIDDNLPNDLNDFIKNIKCEAIDYFNEKLKIDNFNMILSNILELNPINPDKEFVIYNK